MMNITDPGVDDEIKNALKKLDKDDKLDIIAAVSGIAGGVDELRNIMNTEGELHIMDRGMLAIHL